MAIRNIVLEGDDILRKVCKPVEKFDEKLWTLLDDMAETMGVNIPTEDICITSELSGEGWWYRVKEQVFDGFL